MVVQRGNAPRSFAYQANALLLSCGTVSSWRKASVVRRPPHERILFSRQVQPAYICLPSKIGCQGWTRTNTVRFNKPSCYFDTTWQWVREWESHPPEEVYEASLCALVEFPAENEKMVESVGNAPTSACLQGKCIACLPRPRE